jgi:hypothetical protein
VDSGPAWISSPIARVGLHVAPAVLFTLMCVLVEDRTAILLKQHIIGKKGRFWDWLAIAAVEYRLSGHNGDTVVL